MPAKPSMKPFRIFRPGKHTAACGTVIEFTESDLVRAAGAYDPKLYCAPLVIGHPKQEDRAYGWCERISYEDGHLVAHPDHVEPKFSEAVEAKAFRNRSASFYMPDHPSNPVPGTLYPKHIGFLGAVPPSLKGLGDIQFNEEAAPVDFAAVDPRPDLVLEFDEFTNDDRWSIAGMLSSFASTMRAFRDTLIAEKGLEEADKAMPDWRITDTERQALRMEEKARNDSGKTNPAFTETVAPAATTTEEATTMTPEEIAALQAENARLKQQQTEFAERDAALKKAERVTAMNTALEPHVKAGRVLPAQRAQLAAFMATLDDTAQVVEFGEPVDGKVPTVSQLGALNSLLAKLPVGVDYNERSGNATDSTSITQAQFTSKIREKVEASRTAGTPMSYSEASQHVAREFSVQQSDPTNV